MGQAEHAPTTTALTVADLNTEVNCEPRILDVRLAEALGYDRPADIRPLVERHKEALERFGGIIRTVRKNAGRGRPAREMWLNRKQALYVCTKSETARATEISIEVIEVYDAHLAAQAAAPRIDVKAHHRSTPKRPPFTLSQKGRGVMMLDHLVYFDRRILPRVGDEVLYIDQENQPRVGVMQDYPGAEFKPGRVWVEVYPKPTRTWGNMPLIGVVTTAAGKPKRLAAPGGTTA